VPFHFLPGNEGYSFTERLVCRKNSAIAKEMVEHNLALQQADYYLELIGITAHVYADTFSHYGFSGISSRKNKVVNDSFHFYELVSEIESYITEKKEKFDESYYKESGFLANIKSWLAEQASGALGHGAVATYPDRPYLVWDFVYEENDNPSPQRNNPATFLEGCEALYNMFVEVGDRVPGHYEPGKRQEFSAIKETVTRILALQDKKAARVDAWKRSALDGELFGASEEIPEYEDWNEQFRDLDGQEDSMVAGGLNIYKFYQAASLHRQHILRGLLPSHDLIVA
jgi:predicted transcriptional regulator